MRSSLLCTARGGPIKGDHGGSQAISALACRKRSDGKGDPPWVGNVTDVVRRFGTRPAVFLQGHGDRWRHRHLLGSQDRVIQSSIVSFLRSDEGIGTWSRRATCAPWLTWRENLCAVFDLCGADAPNDESQPEREVQPRRQESH